LGEKGSGFIWLFVCALKPLEASKMIANTHKANLTSSKVFIKKNFCLMDTNQTLFQKIQLLKKLIEQWLM
jgi:hypothetical protein